MDKAIVKIGRDNHLGNLFSKLPLITVIFGMQCFFLMQMKSQVNVGEFSTLMGACLIALIGSLYVYDRYHHVIIYKDQIVVHFSLFNLHKVIPLSEISFIRAPAEECDFSSITLELKSNEKISFHFVDYPLQVKSIIEDLQRGDDVSSKIAA